MFTILGIRRCTLVRLTGIMDSMSQGTDNLIENVEIHHTNDYGIHNYSGYATLSSRNVYRNLTLHHTSLLYEAGAAIIASRSDSVTAYNNILYNNTGHGIVVGGQGTNTRIYNNTVYGGSQTGIYLEPGSTSADVRNNIAYANATTQILDLGVGTTLSNNLTNNPALRECSRHLTSISKRAARRSMQE